MSQLGAAEADAQTGVRAAAGAGAEDAVEPVIRAPQRDHRRAILIAGLVAFVVLYRIVALVGVVSTGGNDDDGYRYDSARYHHIASKEGIPYRDFDVEFPPVAVAFIEVVNGDDVESTLTRLGIACLVLDLVVAGGLAFGWGRRAALAYLVIGLPFFLLPFIYFRVDLLSVALATWGLALARRRYERTGGALLGLAVLAKLWPLAVIPALLAARRTRALASSIVTAAVGGAVWLALGGVNGVQQVLTFRGATGWQIESLIGGISRLFTGEFPRQESGALRVGSTSTIVSILLASVMVAIVGFVWWRICRGTTDSSMIYGAAPVTTVAAFMVCSPLLSPQYLIWLTPFAAICWVGGRRAFTFLVAAAVLLTMLLTRSYHALNHAETGAQLLLTARNLVLVATVVFGIATIARETKRSNASLVSAP